MHDAGCKGDCEFMVLVEAQSAGVAQRIVERWHPSPIVTRKELDAMRERERLEALEKESEVQ